MCENETNRNKAPNMFKLFAQLNMLFSAYSACIYESFTGIFRMFNEELLCLIYQAEILFSAIIKLNDITFTLI